jgi:hypothetical protein
LGQQLPSSPAAAHVEWAEHSFAGAEESDAMSASEAGQNTNSPIAHENSADRGAWQSTLFGPQLGACWTEADGQVVLFGQQVSPEHLMSVPGQKTSSASRQVKFAGNSGVQSYFFKLHPCA